MVGIVAAPVFLLLGGGGAGGIDRARVVGDDRAAQGRGAAPSVRGLRKLNAHGGSCRRGAPLTVAIFGGNRQTPGAGRDAPAGGDLSGDTVGGITGRNEEGKDD